MHAILKKWNRIALGTILLMVTDDRAAYAQAAVLQGEISSENGPVAHATVQIKGYASGAASDSLGNYVISRPPIGAQELIVTAIGFSTVEKKVTISPDDTTFVDVNLSSLAPELAEVKVVAPLRSRSNSPVPIAIYESGFFERNPTPSLFDALQQINGVRPQVNCNLCHTGDIHMNGMEGSYTMILIDGMPIVSGLSTVYGLSGIPSSLIERVEVIKGPASVSYGTTAVAGTINVITRSTQTPGVSADLFSSSWGEITADLAGSWRIGSKVSSFAGVNYFNYAIPHDKNTDGFTDMALQNRLSLFNKWALKRPHHRLLTIAARYVYEDRWGGDVRWKKIYRGGDEIYGESIYTRRWELLGAYQLPFMEKLMLRYSWNSHEQNSSYGTTSFIAGQQVGFGQLTWEKKRNNHLFLTGATINYTNYDDNTAATVGDPDKAPFIGNDPQRTVMPGLFIQDEWHINDQHTLLLGLRYDYTRAHGGIVSPRLHYKWQSEDQNNSFRLSAGNGFRTVHVFTEDHAALTGARDIVFLDELRPESSWNGNLNFQKNVLFSNGMVCRLDASAFYTYFSNKIVADYETDPTKIIYDNLSGYGVSQGMSLNMDLYLPGGLQGSVGATLMDISLIEDGVRSRQLFSERFTAVWSLGYAIDKLGVTIDYTGNLYSPMRLPLQHAKDPRGEYSPWWTIQNIQLSGNLSKRMELYGGVKNLLNWTPGKNEPFLIARADDPFDKRVVFDREGQPVPTADNPYGLTFDPGYVYAPNQGRRFFAGIRLKW